MGRWILGAIGCFTVACVSSMVLAVGGTAVLWQVDRWNRENYEPRRAANLTPVATATIDMKNNRFAPPYISVEPGATITWTNSENQPHNVVIRSEGLESPLIKKGESFQTTLQNLGVYDYVCTLHGGMVGTITVAAAEPSPTPFPVE